jgi:Cft2 family RNA processing exonuclease
LRRRLCRQHAGRHPYGETVSRGPVEVTLVPAGHVLGSAQAVLRWKDRTAVISGDYKRRRDPTCPPFEVVPCDLVRQRGQPSACRSFAFRHRMKKRRSC